MFVLLSADLRGLLADDREVQAPLAQGTYGIPSGGAGECREFMKKFDSFYRFSTLLCVCVCVCVFSLFLSLALSCSGFGLLFYLPARLRVTDCYSINWLKVERSRVREHLVSGKMARQLLAGGGSKYPR